MQQSIQISPKFIIEIPCKIQISKKKTFSLNLNEYRNAHYLVLNKAKSTFQRYVGEVLTPLPFKAEQIKVSYSFIPCSNRRYDRMNFISIIDKFFLDSLVKIGLIEDDNDKIVLHGEFLTKKLDKNRKVNYMLIEVEKIK